MGKISQTILMALMLASCAPNVSPSSYSVGGVGQVNRAVRGKIVSVRIVDIQGTQSGLGAGAGAVAGGVGGSNLGGGTRQNIIGAVGGAVVGGIAGAVIENEATKQKGVEYVVETENGSLITVVQGANDPPFVEGQKIIVLYGQQSRIIADTSQH